MSTANQKLRELGLERREITLWLKFEPIPVQHYCMFCREGLFRSQNRIFVLLYGDATDFVFLRPPYSMQCHKCGTIYHLSGLNQ